MRSFIARIKRFFGYVRRWLRVRSWRNKSSGGIGEKLAAAFLKRKNFKILARNWTHAKGELDIVALDKSCGVLVFVEVKLRTGEALVPGYFAVDAKKKNILLRTCKAYLRTFASDDVSYRFDVVEVRRSETGDHEISHYENVKLF